MTRNDILIYAANPAESKMHKVRFIRWFDQTRNYARVEFIETGRRTSVPADRLVSA